MWNRIRASRKCSRCLVLSPKLAEQYRGRPRPDLRKKYNLCRTLTWNSGVEEQSASAASCSVSRRLVSNRCHHFSPLSLPQRMYRGANKGVHVLLSKTQAGPGRTDKQEQEEISRNHVQTFICLSVLYIPGRSH